MTEVRSDEFLPPFSRPRFAALIAGLVVVVMAAFSIFPVLDLAVSELFYMPGPVAWDNSNWRCRGYALGCQPQLSAIRDFLHVLPVICGIILLVVTLWTCWRYGSIFHRQALRYATPVWSLLLGNVVLVDFVLKEHWGRPRPYHPYIGEARFDSYLFVPVGDWRGGCLSNCSFVSGEANALFWMVCATAVLPEEIRKPGFIVALCLAILGSTLRVAFGAHYLSDVIVAGLLAALVFSLVSLAAAQIDKCSASRRSILAI